MRDETTYQRAGEVGPMLDSKQVSSLRMIRSEAFLPVPDDVWGHLVASEPTAYVSAKGEVWRRPEGVGFMATRILERGEDGRSGWSEANLHLGTLDEAIAWVEEDLSNG